MGRLNEAHKLFAEVSERITEGCDTALSHYVQMNALIRLENQARLHIDNGLMRATWVGAFIISARVFIYPPFERLLNRLFWVPSPPPL